MKPIFRWTIGNPNKISLECLEVSIKTMTKLYQDTFEYFICYNNCNIQALREIVKDKPIKLIAQKWDDSPIEVPLDLNVGTSLWKFCPARLDIGRHEIVCDNDVVFIDRFSKLDEFLKSEKVLLVEDPIKYQGQFRDLFAEGEQYNAGFVGLPPNYDLGAAMNQIWQSIGSPAKIGQDDEQGLTTAALKREDFIRVSKDEIKLIHSEGFTFSNTYNKQTNKNNFECRKANFFRDNAFAYHFVGLNRNNDHHHWSLFKRTRKERLI